MGMTCKGDMGLKLHLVIGQSLYSQFGSYVFC